MSAIVKTATVALTGRATNTKTKPEMGTSANSMPFADRQTEREGERQRQTKRDRRTDGKRGRQRETERERERQRQRERGRGRERERGRLRNAFHYYCVLSFLSSLLLFSSFLCTSYRMCPRAGFCARLGPEAPTARLPRGAPGLQEDLHPVAVVHPHRHGLVLVRARVETLGRGEGKRTKAFGLWWAGPRQ